MRAGRLSFDARMAGTAILTAVLASLLAFQAARADEPERILSLGGAVTETVAALGALKSCCFDVT